MRWIARHRWVALAVVLLLLAGGTIWYLTSSGEDFTVTEHRVPTNGVNLDMTFYAPNGAGRKPAVLLAHGFGGSKDTVDEQARELAGRGYAVLAWTARGFGKSTGEIHLNARDYEVRDAQGLIDWLALRPDVALDAAGDPRVAVVGGSYGGSLALNLAGVDKRVDAIVPQITYNDLARSLLPEATGRGPAEGVFKKGWAGVLFGAGSQFAGPTGAPADPQCGRFAKDVCAAFLDVATTGRPTPQSVELLRSVSPQAVVGDITAPTLLVQGLADSLFTPAEAEANAKAIGRPGGPPLRLAWFSGGHDGGAGSRSDADRVKFLTVQWLDHYLLGTGPTPSGSFTYSRVTGVNANEQGLASTGYELKAYPDLAGTPASRRALALAGPPQRIANPPNGVPSAISALPGLGALTSSGLSSLLSLEIPGQFAAFETRPVTEAVDILGSPTVQLTATADAVLYVKLYDVSPTGEATLPNGLVSPVRIGADGGPVTVTLPAIVRRLDVGHKLRVVVATADQAYAGPAQPTVYTVQAVGAVTVPTVEGLPLTSAATPLAWALAGLVALLLVGVGAALLVGRRRHARRDEAVVPEFADTPLLVRGLRKEYAGGYVAVRDVSFTVERGQVVGLLGPNGAGKTTSMRVLMGLTNPSAGEVLIFGHRLIPGAPVLSRLGALVEGPGFLPHLTGMENLRLYWQATGRPWSDARLDEVVAIANLGNGINRKARTYSHGMKQRLAIAQAMLGLPELLVLDEPTDGLDPPQIAEMRRVLKQYAVDGRAVLVSSHLLAEVEQTCTHVVVVNQGRLVAAGPVSEMSGDGQRLEDAFLALVEGGPDDDRG